MLKVYACYPRRRTLWTQNGAHITVVATLSIYGSDLTHTHTPPGVKGAHILEGATRTFTA